MTDITINELPDDEKKVCFERLHNFYQDEKMVQQIQEMVHLVGPEQAFANILLAGKDKIDLKEEKTRNFYEIVYNAVLHIAKTKNDN